VLRELAPFATRFLEPGADVIVAFCVDLPDEVVEESGGLGCFNVVKLLS